MTEKQEALKEMPDGSDINDIGDWAFKHRNTIRAALTETPKADVVGWSGDKPTMTVFGLWQNSSGGVFATGIKKITRRN